MQGLKVHEGMNKGMDNRGAKRITAGYKTEIIYGNKSYPGVIENISASGANVLTDQLEPGMNFVPDDPIELKFDSPAGKTVILKCKVMWSTKIPPHDIRHRIGMEIDELPWANVGEFL